MRQCGKKSNHGLNYDEGPNTFALVNEMEQSEAKVIVELYHSIYPGIRLWYESIKRQLQKDRSLTNCFGRKVRFMDSWGPDLWKAAYSMLPQSSVVDSLNLGLVKTYNDDQITRLFNIDLLAQVHDSILFQVPIDVFNSPTFQKIRDRVYDYVSPELKYNNRTFKLATDSKVGLNWGGYNSEYNPDGMRDLTNENYPTVSGELNARVK
jgi:DNA polymerase I-like protein with 3'-5' exonuclease and polymerase domains